MLSRGNSEASARLRRAKSSASIKTRRTLSSDPRISDPSAAKEHALAAASYAFWHAPGADLSAIANQGIATHIKTSDPERTLTRSRSIRFAGSNALPGRDLPITMRQAPGGLTDREARRRSLNPDFRRINSSIEDGDGCTTALPSHSDYVETHPASPPSSYRTVRKSKSMFSPRNLSASYSDNALKPTASRLGGNVQSSVSTNRQRRVPRGSRLGRSFSFLRHDDHIPSSLVCGDTAQNEAVGLARDEYFRQLERRNLDEDPSKGKAAVRRHSQKTFQKTVRTSSMNSRGSPWEIPRGSSKAWLEGRGVSSKAKDLSSSFKNRLRRVFNRSSGSEATFPAQHLQATRLHFGDSTTPYAWSEGQGRSTESLNHTHRSSAQQIATLHVSGRRASPANGMYGGNNDVDVDDNKSRVTSWTNSTAADTLANRQNSAPKRLSIVQEKGSVPLYCGSPWQHGLLQSGPPFSGTQPRKSSLYAKLQHRMNEGTSRTAILSNEISQVSPGNPIEPPEARKLSHVDQGLIHPSISVSPKGSLPRDPVGDTLLSPQPEGTAIKARAEEVADTTPKGPLCESKSTFFPQSTRIERRRISPFRQAMRQKGQSEKTSLTNVLSTPRGRHEDAAYIDASRMRERSLARSESVYSRTSSGNSPHPCKSSTSPGGIEDCSDNRTTFITLGESKKRSEAPPEITYGRTPADRIDVGARHSVSGKRLLLDHQNSLRDRTSSVGRKRWIGHKREHAQIDDEDSGIGTLHPSTGVGEASSTGSPTSPDVRSSIRQSSQAMVDRFPLISITAQSNLSQGGRNFPTKPGTATGHPSEIIQHQTPDQSDRSREYVHPGQVLWDPSSFSNDMSVCTKQTSDGKQNDIGLHENIHNSELIASSTPLSHSRSSPERIARLRRIYSSHNLGSPEFRKPIGRSPKWQTGMYKKENRALREKGLGVPHRGQHPHSDGLDLVVEGRSMVDVFLEHRKKSQNDGVEGAVFI
ncbi:MAG: hypothetical protein Q9184_007159 [Pyrenodesmia sp. 2 TL-2023]